MACSDNYSYTVPELLHEAGKHRRSDHSTPCPGLENCHCEDDHVIELQLVVAALNTLSDDTYSSRRWQRRLVNFFNKKHQNSQPLPHQQHLEKTHSVKKWLDKEYLTDEEMDWIDEIRETWDEVKDHLRGFGQFKVALDDVLDMDDYYE